MIKDSKKKFNSVKSILNQIPKFKVARTCMILGISIYIPLLILSVIIAAIFGPQGYSLTLNWISDLGGSAFTPVPYLYDIACIFAGMLTVPFSFYMEQYLAPLPKTKVRAKKISKLRLALSTYTLLSSLIGNVGYIGVGIFSEDRNYFNLHSYTSALAFGGFTLAAMLMGFLILFYDTGIPKPLGVYGVFGPSSALILFLIINQMGSFLAPYFEWMLLFSILIWIIPLSIIVFHEDNWTK